MSRERFELDRLYLDEDACAVDLRLALSRTGLLVLDAAVCGMLAEADEAQLSFAAECDLVLVGHHVADYQRLHGEWLRNGRRHAGIAMVVQQRYSVGELVRRLSRLASELTPAQMRDRLEFLSRWN